MRSVGLRLQLLLALGTLVLAAYMPLYFGIMSVTRLLGRASEERVVLAEMRGFIAAHGHDSCALTGAAPVTIVGCVRFERGQLVESRGPNTAGLTASPIDRRREDTIDVAGVVGEGESVTVRALVELHPPAVPVSQVFLLYIGLFGIVLLAFSYVALTRLIVRPIEELARGADDVAGGARKLRLPRGPSREIAALGDSLQSMTTRLIAEEAALRLKVKELTETTEKLTQMQSQLVRSEQMASVGRLAAGVAHEIGNPIAAILGLFDLMDDDLDAETKLDFLGRIRKETERIKTIVRDLLDFARPERGNDASGILPCATVEQALDDVLSLVKPQRQFRDIDVETDLKTDSVAVSLSTQRITQVVLNLMLNAAGALENTAKPRIVVRLIKVGDVARIEVEDNGPGVAEDLTERIFLPFVTTKDVGEGSGLGLSVCRGLVEAARGRIFVDRTYTKGARFVVELPLVSFD